MKIGIIGTRNFYDYKKFCNLLKQCEIDWSGVTGIVSGGARGIDTYAKRFANEMNIPMQEFLPEYSRYGKVAPLVRNTAIVEFSDRIIAFRAEGSRGTQDAINKAISMNKKIEIIDLGMEKKEKTTEELNLELPDAAFAGNVKEDVSQEEMLRRLKEAVKDIPCLSRELFLIQLWHLKKAVKDIPGVEVTLEQETGSKKKGKTTEELNLELLDAAFAGNTRKIKSVLDGLAPEEVNFWGKKAMAFAVNRNHVDVMKLLLKRGIYTPIDGIYAAIILDDFEKFEKLLEEDTYARATQALRVAVKLKKRKFVKKILLADYTFDFYATDKDGKTALDIAKENSNEMIVFLLSMYQYKNKQLVKAVKNSNIEQIKLCLQTGAKVNFRHENGKTALDYANNEEILKLLSE